MGTLFGGGNSQPTQVVKATPAAPMPDADSAQVREAKKNATEALAMRAGRASTIMTTASSSDTKGGDTYASPKLGN